MKFTIIGAGAFGKALGNILENNNHKITYYDPFLFEISLEDAISGADYIIYAAPSKVAPELLPKLPKDIPLIIASKGFLSEDLFTDFNNYMILSGSGFAKQITSGVQTFFTVTDKKLFEIFKSDFITFDYTDDKLGVLICGALKNIYAILAGLLDVKSSTEIWESYIAGALEEMRAVLKVNHADPDTVKLACGVMDLKLTCDAPSRNYEFGQRLRQNPNYQPEKTVEGVTALKRIKRGEIVVPPEAVKLNRLMEMSDKWA